MSDASSPRASREWWVRPAVVLPVVGALLTLLMLLMPEQSVGRIGDSRLSSHLATPLGARALKDLASRLGWHAVSRDSSAVPVGTPGHTVHALLDPPREPTAAQAHRYLEAVRGGDALLLVLGERNPLSDSLGYRHSRIGGWLVIAAADSAGCGARGRDYMPALWPDGRVHLFGLRAVRGRAAGAVTFASVTMGSDSSRPTQEAAVGFTLGRGRVVVVSDPDLLRNDVLRRCAWGADVIAVRMLEWLRSGGEVPRTALQFDEYHQGFGPRETPTSVTRRFLGTHPVGRTILQLGLAALVLLLALSPRAIPPVPRTRTERRDPLEQADALAHAYEQVHATRTATQRMVRGLRRRAERAGGRTVGEDDDAFLTIVARDHPQRTADVTLVQRMLRAPHAASSLPEVGAALRRIEHSLSVTMAPNA